MILKNLNVVLVLGSRFPTERAYGITSRQTLESLLTLGVKTRIYSLDSEYTDPDFELSKQFTYSLYQGLLFKFFLYISKIINGKSRQRIWKLSIVISVVMSILRIKRQNPTIIWVRDPALALIFRIGFRKKYIVLEVHDFNISFIYKILSLFKSGIYFAPINQANSEFIRKFSPLGKICLSPMGVRSENLVSFDSIDKFCLDLANVHNGKRKLKIGYIGKLAPGGYSKGAEDLVFLAHFLQENNFKSQVSLIGATPDERILFNKLQAQLSINVDYLEIHPHINHTTALQLMGSFDVLVLPMPKGGSYVGMPIKLLEYLASGRIVMVAKCDLFITIFDKEFLPYFYTPGDIKSLHEQINFAIKDKNLNFKIKSGVNFAREFTWEKRTLHILDYVLKEKGLAV